MKTSKTYRLSNETLESLDDLSKALKMNHTQVIEMVLDRAVVVRTPEVECSLGECPEVSDEVAAELLAGVTSGSQIVRSSCDLLGVISVTLYAMPYGAEPLVTVISRAPHQRHCERFTTTLTKCKFKTESFKEKIMNAIQEIDNDT